MNIIQFFHKKEESPMFNIGDKVRLKDNLAGLFPLHPPMDGKKLKEIHQKLEGYIGIGVHKVSKITKGTPEAGGWFVYLDNKEQGYHGNIFELVK